ncbi:MAG: hypothetical protein QNJ00_14825 [Woeseiaceae bacterium]|nr:hypothetical protein [Woeseiaceae bacterium]
MSWWKRDKSGIRASSDMLANQRVVRTRFTLWGSNLEADTSEMLPAILWVVLGIYVAWFATFLVFTLDNGPIRGERHVYYLGVFRAIVAGVVPVVGAYIVGSDKSWGQWYVPLSFFLLFVAALSRDSFYVIMIDWILVATLGLFIVISALVLLSPVCQTFYAEVRENERTRTEKANP